jgi:hypothetical protein
MDASEGGLVLPPLLDGPMITLLLRILHDPEVLLVLTVAANVPEAMPKGRPKSLEDRRKEQAIST